MTEENKIIFEWKHVKDEGGSSARFVYEYNLEDGTCGISASLRKDGVVHLYDGFQCINDEEKLPAPFQDNIDYLMICDIDKMISMLNGLKDKYKEYFGVEYEMAGKY